MCTATLLPKEEKRPATSGEVGPAGQRQGILQFGSYLQYFKRPILGGLLAEFFLYLFSFSVFLSGFALFAERRYTWQGHPFSPREIGLVFALSGFVGIIVHGGLLADWCARWVRVV